MKKFLPLNHHKAIKVTPLYEEMSDTKSKIESGDLPKDLSNPIQLAEKLSLSVELDRGNTPRPSKAVTSFFDFCCTSLTLSFLF